MTPFEHDTYIVLELPEPFAAAGLRIRKKYDAGLSAFPAEMTVAGSSGVGPLAGKQEPEKVFTILNEIAALQAPIKVRFKGIRRFPNTNLFYLALIDPEPLIKLHARIAASGLRFNDAPFHFTPHCTLADLSESDEESIKSIREEVYPQKAFLLDTLSVYEVTNNRCLLQYRTMLKGK